jgi:hypothetical protein
MGIGNTTPSLPFILFFFRKTLPGSLTRVQAYEDEGVKAEVKVIKKLEITEFIG